METQTSMFPNVLRRIDLTADSPRKAWWRLTLVECMGQYYLVKESGIKGHLLDRRKWPVKNLRKALILFDKKVKLKTDPNRNSKRIYEVAA